MENLTNIVKKNIKPNQVVLLGTVLENSTAIELEVLICSEGHPDAEVEKQARAMTLAFNGVVVYLGQADKIKYLMATGARVVLQKAALEEAEKEQE